MVVEAEASARLRRQPHVELHITVAQRDAVCLVVDVEAVVCGEDLDVRVHDDGLEAVGEEERGLEQNALAAHVEKARDLSIVAAHEFLNRPLGALHRRPLHRRLRCLLALFVTNKLTPPPDQPCVLAVPAHHKASARLHRPLLDLALEEVVQGAGLHEELVEARQLPHHIWHSLPDQRGWLRLGATQPREVERAATTGTGEV
mmetsp:Transcript_39208/g.78519  ORF Transcript_39208/g.78519 Transcript_39208/m.78519 type:complete len:202 (+) Transcript_39208:371-976(+)